MLSPAIERNPAWRPAAPKILLTARQLAEEYGYPLSVAQSLVKDLGKRGLTERIPEFRRGAGAPQAHRAHRRRAVSDQEHAAGLANRSGV
jgi:hypothetical protein